MKIPLLLLFTIQFSIVGDLKAITPPVTPITVLQPKQKKAISFPISFLATIKIKTIEDKIGHKLSLKEKIAFKILQRELKRTNKPVKQMDKKNKAKTAFILGLAGAIALFIPIVNLASIPLAIMAIVIGNKAKRDDPNNRKAKTAVTLGLLTLSFLVVIGLVVAIVLTFGAMGPR